MCFVQLGNLITGLLQNAVPSHKGPEDIYRLIKEYCALRLLRASLATQMHPFTTGRRFQLARPFPQTPERWMISGLPPTPHLELHEALQVILMPTQVHCYVLPRES